ncbi:hypothetical protein K4K54_009278 [Colletotrichum sp. SAR 10_86]|nr:hypothetical protein K4K54_009278 [Colletotrichum sp. SAR 10_86]
MAFNTNNNGTPNMGDQSNPTSSTVETVSEDDAYAVRIIQIPDSKWKRRYRSVAFQMVLLSLLSFSGPSMSNVFHIDSCCTLLLIPVYILTYFGDGVWGTYLSLHFSVRARALSAMLGPLVAVVMNPLFGMILDMKSVGPRRKGMIAYWVWTVPTLGMLIWVMVNLKWFNNQPKDLRLDYAMHTSQWLARWLPYLIYVTNAWMSQTLVYWVLGQFASDVSTNARTGGVFRSWETAGQAVSYGINSHVASQFIPFGIYIGVFLVAMPLFYMVLLEVPVEDRVLKITTDDGQILTDAVKIQDAAIVETGPTNLDAK